MIITATGFDLYPTIADLESQGWNDYGSAAPVLEEVNVCSIHSRQSLRAAWLTQFLSPLWAVPDTVFTYFAFWFMFDYVPSASRTFAIILDQQIGQETKLVLTTSYEIELLNPVSSQLGISGTNALTKDQWHYLEIKWVAKNSISSNDCIIKVDGNEVINVAATTDTNYYGRQTAGLNLYGPPGQVSVYNYFDDFIHYTSEGTDWTDFKGPRYISTLKPNGNGNYSQWTRSGGTNNYEMLDDDEFDGDTTYVNTSTLSNRDSYAFENLHTSVNSVDAVQEVVVGKKTAGINYRTVVPFARISSADYDDSYPASLSDDGAYRLPKRLWYESPATATAWTPAEINGAEFGIKVAT
jgi:hypothetical protein